MNFEEIEKWVEQLTPEFQRKIQEELDALSDEEIGELALEMEQRYSNKEGVSVGQLINGEMPIPTYIIQHGKDIPEHVMTAMRKGEAALVVNEEGEVLDLLIICSAGRIRNKPVEFIRKDNQRKRLKYFPGEG